MTNRKKLWEVLVPTHTNEHAKIDVEHHKTWDQFVEKITNGLTIEKPSRGIWRDETGEQYEERMIPVKIVCTETKIKIIADFTAKHYQQKAVLFYKVSDIVHIYNYDAAFKRKNK